MIYANFFSPNIISLLFCLHQSTSESQQRDPHSPVVKFLIQKILQITESSKINLSNKDFQRQLFQQTNNEQILQKYQNFISKIQTFNDFYRHLSKSLKSLRSLRNNKLEQGNLVDFLVRRMYIYFEKLDFKQIINIYQLFCQYLNGIIQPPQHQFMLTKSIQQLKFNLQNYHIQNPQFFAQQVLELAENDHTHKTSYLKALINASQKAPLQSVSCLHRYFDQSLGHLFQQKGQSQLSGNKINHCILSSGFVQLKMDQLQECLQSISEGLRISQNNSDQQAINNCIIYLYKISQQLGKFGQQILLNQHAITHSLNLSNIQLMIYSCLNYSLFQRKYNCSDPNIVLLKNRNISWTDALHFSKKKIYSTFQSSCKNIYHTYRNLLIPSFMAKVAVIAHLPELKPMLINTYYNRPQLIQLQIYQQFEENGKIDKQIQEATRYIKNGQVKLTFQALQKLKTKQKVAHSPFQIIKIKQILAKSQFQIKNYSQSFTQSQKLAEICEQYGFVKQQILQANILAIRSLIKSHLYYQALIKSEIAKKRAIQARLNQFKLVCELLQAQNYIYLKINIQQAINIVKDIDQSCAIPKFRNQFKIIFYETKAMAYQLLNDVLESKRSNKYYIQYNLNNKLSKLKRKSSNVTNNYSPLISNRKISCILDPVYNQFSQLSNNILNFTHKQKYKILNQHLFMYKKPYLPTQVYRNKATIKTKF